MLAAPAPDRSKAWRVELPPPRHAAIADFRVALWTDEAACPVSGDTVAAVEAAGQALVDAGSVVDRTARPDIDPDAAARLGLGLVGAAVTPSMGGEEYRFVVSLAGDPNLSDADRADRRGLRLEPPDVAGHGSRRAHIRRAWAAFFEEHDVLVCPVIASPPFPHQQEGSMADRISTSTGRHAATPSCCGGAS